MFDLGIKGVPLVVKPLDIRGCFLVVSSVMVAAPYRPYRPYRHRTSLPQHVRLRQGACSQPTGDPANSPVRTSQRPQLPSGNLTVCYLWLCQNSY